MIAKTQDLLSFDISAYENREKCTHTHKLVIARYDKTLEKNKINFQTMYFK